MKELRISRWDQSLKPYSLEAFLAYYPPDPGRNMWKAAAICQDAAGENREVLLRMGEYQSWGLVARLPEESAVLATRLALNDSSPVSDLSEVVGGGVHIYILRRIEDAFHGSP